MDADQLNLLSDLIARARAAGADAADAVLISGTSLSVQRRLGATEHVERAEGRDLGLRVFLGQRAAMVSSTTMDPASFTQLAARAVAMARVVPEDPYARPRRHRRAARTGSARSGGPGRADHRTARRAAPRRPRRRRWPCLASPTRKAPRPASAESRRSWSPRPALPAAWCVPATRSRPPLWRAAERRCSATIDYHSTVYLADLDDPTAIGRSAGERAIARLNPNRPATARLPIVYDPRVAGGLLGHLAGAINGASVARGTSFLKDRMGQRLFTAGIVVHDDPRRVRGLRSRMFDGEGTPTAARALIDDGVLTTWLLDSRSARQLGLRPTGHAARGTGGPPSPGPSNLYLAAGSLTPAELMADIKLGLYVTELIGMGVNGVTGDYSRGAAGFMIRDGALAEPVAEITVAGNLLEMFAHLTPADDLRFRRGTNSPTVRVDGMTMAGA